MSIVVSFKKKMIHIIDDDKYEYIVLEDNEVDPGEVDDEDLFRYKKAIKMNGDR